MQLLTVEIQERGIQNLSLAEKQEKVREAINEFNSLKRRTVKQAWVVGTFFRAIKSELDHGDWFPWLEENGVEPRTAQRLIQLATYEIRELVAFDSIDAALKAISKPRKEKSENGVIDPEVIVEEKLTSAEKRLLREDALVQQARDAEAEKAKVEEELKKVQQKIKLFEEEKRVDEGFQRGASVLDHAQNEVSNLRAKIADKEIKERELMSENQHLRQKLGRVQKQKEKLEKQLEAFKEGEV